MFWLPSLYETRCRVSHLHHHVCTPQGLDFRGSLKWQFLNGDAHYGLLIHLSPTGFMLLPPLVLVNSAMEVECLFPYSPEEKNDSTSYAVVQWSYTLLSFVSCTGLTKC